VDKPLNTKEVSIVPLKFGKMKDSKVSSKELEPIF